MELYGDGPPVDCTVSVPEMTGLQWGCNVSVPEVTGLQ